MSTKMKNKNQRITPAQQKARERASQRRANVAQNSEPTAPNFPPSTFTWSHEDVSQVVYTRTRNGGIGSVAIWLKNNLSLVTDYPFKEAVVSSLTEDVFNRYLQESFYPLYDASPGEVAVNPPRRAPHTLIAGGPKVRLSTVLVEGVELEKFGYSGSDEDESIADMARVTNAMERAVVSCR